MTQPQQLPRATYAQSEALQELGLDWTCLWRVKPNGEAISPKKLKIAGDDLDAIPQPETALIFRWAWETHRIFVSVQPMPSKNTLFYFTPLVINDKPYIPVEYVFQTYPSWEDAETAALDFLIGHLKESK